MNLVYQTMIIYINKPYGKTPNEIINELKKEPKYINKKISFAGRLDPMATGILMLLIDDDCLKQDIYIKHDKIYRFKLVIGLSTDSHDILGKLLVYNLHYNFESINDYLIDNIKNKFTGTIEQYYPAYSSKRLNGKPLWFLKKNNLLKDEDIPKKQVTIKYLKFLKKTQENIDTTIDYFLELIKKVSNKYNFRQNEIIDIWEMFKVKYNTKKIIILDFETHVSSGTYIRQLAHDIGRHINIPCLALNIDRIKFIND